MLNDALAELRTMFDITQRELAAVLEIDRSTYTSYEVGRSKPDFVTVSKLARFYNISLDDIVLLAQGLDSDKSFISKEFIAESDTQKTDPKKLLIDKLNDFYDLSDDERELVFFYRSCENKKKILDFIHAENKSESINERRKPKKHNSEEE